MIAPAAVGCTRMLGCRWQVYNRDMTSRAQELLREALKLPLEERADVAAELLASLDDAEREHPDEVEAAWAVEIERRARRVLAGESAGVPWEDVRRRAEEDLRLR
jgi:putative addiction module component (TIGR02574 family)